MVSGICLPLCSGNILLLLTVLLFEYFGLSLADAGLLMLVTRIWDAVSDPMMGVIADRTHTRWGKYRPYLLWIAAPFAIAGILLFTTPDMGTTGKLVWAYVTYILMMTVYTAINVPYGAMLGVMTDDSNTKTVFSSYRMFLHTEVVLSLWEHGSHCVIGLNQWTIAMLPVGNMPWYALPRSAFGFSVLL